MASLTAARATGRADPSLTSPAMTSLVVRRPAVSCSVVSVLMGQRWRRRTPPAQGRTSRAAGAARAPATGRPRPGGGRSALTARQAPPYGPEGAPPGCSDEEDAMRAVVYHG